MEVSCPHCRAPLSLAEVSASARSGRLFCPHCSATFVVRAAGTGGRPEAGLRRDPTLQDLDLDVKDSMQADSAAGEIGDVGGALVPADTLTTVVVDPQLRLEALLAGVDQAISPNAVATAERAKISASPTLPEVDADALQRTPTEPVRESEESEVELVPDAPGAVVSGPTVAGAGPASVSGSGFEALNPVENVGLPVGVPLAVMRALGATHVDKERFRTGETPLVQRSWSDLAPVADNQPTAKLPTFAFESAADPDDDVQAAAAEALASTGPEDSAERAAGGRMLISIIGLLLVGAFAVLVFVLARNDWTIDPANVDRMFSRAFGEVQQVHDESDVRLADLIVSGARATRVELAGGEQAIAVRGDVRNDGAVSRRFIYVVASIRRRGVALAHGEAPADNDFSDQELARLSSRDIDALLNPAGRQRLNVEVKPGQAVPYLVLITTFPPGLDLSSCDVVARPARAELYGSR